MSIRLGGGGGGPRRHDWMMFVDGENLAIRGKAVVEAKGHSMLTGEHYVENTYLWFPGKKGYNKNEIASGRVALEQLSLRSFYCTAVQGDPPKGREIKEALQKLGFTPRVFHEQKDEPRKRVDIQLTIDMLTNAFMSNYETCILVAGDQDYVPIVNEVQRLGKVVMLAFFEHAKGGLSPDLKMECDSFKDLTPTLLDTCCASV